MRNIVLISCASKKQDAPAPAREIYTSPLFRRNLAYAGSLDPDAIYVLSAKHGLVELDETIEPYDFTLGEMGMLDQRRWARRVRDQLDNVANLHVDHFIFLAEKQYRQNLLPYLTNYEVPTKGLPTDDKLEWLEEQTE